MVGCNQGLEEAMIKLATRSDIHQFHRETITGSRVEIGLMPLVSPGCEQREVAWISKILHS